MGISGKNFETLTRPEKKRNEPKADNNRPSDKQLQEEIKTTAYYRFISRGGKPGNELADWFQAEREVKRRYQLI